MKKLTLLSCLLGLAGTALAQDGPPTMTKMVVRDASPGIKDGSFDSLPKTIYRWGRGSVRVEEQPADDGKHIVLIQSEQQSWIFDLAKKTGTHQTGAPAEPHVPIVSEPTLSDLELGRELEFLKAHPSKPVGQQNIDGKDCEILETTVGSYTVDVGKPKGDSSPVVLAVRNSKDQIVRQLFYGSYVRNLPIQKELFRPPADVRFDEGKP
jgi:hypothetical protein